MRTFPDGGHGTAERAERLFARASRCSPLARASLACAVLVVCASLASCAPGGPEFRLAGRVVDERGIPLAGCSVEPSSPSFDRPGHSVETVADGTFDWGPVPQGDYSITATCRAKDGSRLSGVIEGVPILIDTFVTIRAD